MGDTVAKKPRGRNVVVEDFFRDQPEGANAKYADHLLQIASLPPVDRNDLEALERRLFEYVEICKANDMKIGNQACYMALGIDKNTIYDWTHDRSRPSHSDFAKKVRNFCAFYRENLMQDGRINPVTGVFWQCNYDGLVDVKSMNLNVVPLVDPLGDTQDATTLAQKYAATLPSADTPRLSGSD